MSRTYKCLPSRCKPGPLLTCCCQLAPSTQSQQQTAISPAVSKLHAEGLRVQLTVYISCYVEAQNRDAFMAVRQDLMLAFIDCVHRNRAELARTRLGVSPKLSMPVHGFTLHAGNVASIRLLARSASDRHWHPVSTPTSASRLLCLLVHLVLAHTTIKGVHLCVGRWPVSQCHQVSH